VHDVKSTVYERTMAAPKPGADEMNPFQDLKSEYRARRAREVGSVGALVISAMYVLTGFLTLARDRQIHTLIGDSNRLIAGVHFCVALLAAGLYFAVAKTRSVVAASILMAWAVIEMFPWLPSRWIGHGTAWPMPVLIMTLAILALRGTLKLNKILAEPPAGQEPAIPR
jgi:hypothetical protein